MSVANGTALHQSDELLVTLSSTKRATNLTLTEQGLQVVSIDEVKTEDSALPPLSSSTDQMEIASLIGTGISTLRSWLFCKGPVGSHQSFPYLNILNAQVTRTSDAKITHVEVRAASLTGSASVLVIDGVVDEEHVENAQSWVDELLSRAYGNVKRNRRLRVLINPLAGPGKCRSQWIKQVEPIFRSAGSLLDVTYTERQGHGKEIAEGLDVEAYDALVIFSGDGLLYEAVNGFCERKDALTALKSCPLAALPGGSGNAMCVSLQGPELGYNLVQNALTVIKGQPMSIDISSITSASRGRYYSFLSQAFGLMADVDLGSEHLRWMGSARFVVSFIQKALGGPSYDCEISMRITDSDKHAMKEDVVRKRSTKPSDNENPFTDSKAEGETAAMPPLRFGTVSDRIPVSPDATPIAGSAATGWTTVSSPICFMFAGSAPYLSKDLLQFPIANIDGKLVLSILPVVNTKILLSSVDGAEKGKHYDLDQLEYYKVEAFRLTPKPKDNKQHFISIDGEHAPFEPFQVEIHAGIGSVLSLRESWYLPKDWQT